MAIASLEPEVDTRAITIRVASPAALLVAKAYKIGERQRDAPERLLDKDAHDIYRLLRAMPLTDITTDLRLLHADEIAAQVTRTALRWLDELTTAPDSLLPQMAGRSEHLAGEPADVARASWALVRDVLDASAGVSPSRG